MNKPSSVYDKVVSLLQSNQHYRDDDRKLVCRFWQDELSSLGISHNMITAFDFLCLYAREQLSTADSITRARRKAQEENVSLRGASYHSRKSLMEEIKKDIRNLG